MPHGLLGSRSCHGVRVSSRLIPPAGPGSWFSLHSGTRPATLVLSTFSMNSVLSPWVCFPGLSLLRAVGHAVLLLACRLEHVLDVRLSGCWSPDAPRSGEQGCWASCCLAVSDLLLHTDYGHSCLRLCRDRHQDRLAPPAGSVRSAEWEQGSPLAENQCFPGPQEPLGSTDPTLCPTPWRSPYGFTQAC